MLSAKHVEAIGSVLTNTFGREGSPSGATSITHSMNGDVLVLKFVSVVHFAEERSLRLQVDRVTQESVQLLGDKLKEVKAAFKDITGEALKVKEINSRDDVEMVSGTVHSARRVAYYRRNHWLQILN